MSFQRTRLITITATMLALASCTPAEDGNPTGMAGSSGGGAGTSGGAAGTSGGSAGTSGGGAGTTANTAGTSGGGAGTSGGGAGTSGGSAGTSGGGAGTSGGTAGTSGGTAGTTGGTAGTTGGSAGTSGTVDPPPPRPIAVTGTGVFNKSINGQQAFFNRDKKPVQGKLVLFLGGISNGRTTGSGGFDAFVKQYGFHTFLPMADHGLVGGDVPQMYKDTIKTDPTNKEANRQVGDARMELWDGKDRVTWNTTSVAESILSETTAMLKQLRDEDPASDWGFFLNADDTLRTTDVYVVGYSWGAQTWSMMSQYVRFGRVIVTAGPVDEGFPNGTWMTDRPSATPDDRKYALIDQQMPWPTEMNAKFKNVMKAGWVGPVTNVMPNMMPNTFTADQHLFSMLGSGPNTPGGHTVFCTDNSMNGWIPVCKHVMGIK
jgi:hypothetical protein